MSFFGMLSDLGRTRPKRTMMVRRGEKEKPVKPPKPRKDSLPEVDIDKLIGIIDRVMALPDKYPMANPEVIGITVLHHNSLDPRIQPGPQEKNRRIGNKFAAELMGLAMEFRKAKGLEFAERFKSANSADSEMGAFVKTVLIDRSPTFGGERRVGQIYVETYELQQMMKKAAPKWQEVKVAVQTYRPYLQEAGKIAGQILSSESPAADALVLIVRNAPAVLKSFKAMLPVVKVAKPAPPPATLPRKRPSEPDPFYIKSIHDTIRDLGKKTSSVQDWRDAYARFQGEISQLDEARRKRLDDQWRAMVAKEHELWLKYGPAGGVASTPSNTIVPDLYIPPGQPVPDFPGPTPQPKGPDYPMAGLGTMESSSALTALAAVAGLCLIGCWLGKK